MAVIRCVWGRKAKMGVCGNCKRTLIESLGEEKFWERHDAWWVDYKVRANQEDRDEVELFVPDWS